MFWSVLILSNHISQADFTKIVNAFKNASNSITCNLNRQAFTEEQEKALSGYIVDILYRILPMNRDKYIDGLKFLRITVDAMKETWGLLHHGNPSLDHISRNMMAKYPIPQDVVLNDYEITINTKCGETRTIQMSQEITSVEYMGKVFTKDSDGDFME